MQQCCQSLRTKKNVEAAFPHAAGVARAIREAGRGHDLPNVLVYGACRGCRYVLVKALVDEAVAAGCPLGSRVDCAAAEEIWKPELRDAAQRARSAPVTSALSGEHERRVGVVYNVDSAGKGPGSSRTSGSASDSFIKSCVEISPYCWWIMTSSGSVWRGLSSGAWKISATPKTATQNVAAPVRSPANCPAEALRKAASDLVRQKCVGVAPGDTSASRRAIDALLSKGYSDADIIGAALDGFLEATHSGSRKRAVVAAFAKHGCKLAKCRRPVWKGCVMELCLLEAFFAASEDSGDPESASEAAPEAAHASVSSRSSSESADDQQHSQVAVGPSRGTAKLPPTSGSRA